MEKQYLDLCKRLISEGAWVENDRTGKRCLTVINADFEYDCSTGKLPLVTTREAFYKSAFAEMLGYLRGYDNAQQFRDIGCPTWNSNANKTQAWLDNPIRKGEDDMGRVYGVQGRGWRRAPTDEEYQLLNDYAQEGNMTSFNELLLSLKDNQVDQLKRIYNDLKQGIDNRGEALTFWNPSEFELGCLRPCMHTHTFSILGDTLHLTSYQRSIDVPLGLVFNMPQTVMLLTLMAQITGLKAGKVFHKMINCHIYEDQIDLMHEQLKRTPLEVPDFSINPEIKTLEDIETWVTRDDFYVTNYKSHSPIKYPFSE
jgi:thymidylate synthase